MKKLVSLVLMIGLVVGMSAFCHAQVKRLRISHANYVLAMAYIGWVTSPEGQKIISEFGKTKFGQPLFIPVAVPYIPEN